MSDGLVEVTCKNECGKEGRWWISGVGVQYEGKVSSLYVDSKTTDLVGACSYVRQSIQA